MEKEIWDRFVIKDELLGKTDNFDRNCYSHSNRSNILTPEVSQYLLKKGFLPKYPNRSKFALCVSHDVDVLNNRLNYSTLKTAFKEKKNIIYLKQSLKGNRGNRKFDIDQVLGIGNKYGIRSSFYFLSLLRGELDFNYELKEMKSNFEKIVHSNGEIGLHGGFNAYMDKEKIKQERGNLETVLGHKVGGYRGHFLKFKNPITWSILNDLNFEYDTTLGYANQIGFRNGMCHPFRPYSIEKNKFLDIMELPLVIMDITLTKYMGLNAKDQLSFCKNVIDTVEQNRGVLTLLWHNDRMLKEELEIYEAILKYATSKKPWMATGKQVSDYWRSEKYDLQQMEILNDCKAKS